MDRVRFTSDFDSAACYLIWLPASIPFIAVFMLSAAIVLPVAWAVQTVWRGWRWLRGSDA